MSENWEKERMNETNKVEILVVLWYWAIVLCIVVSPPFMMLWFEILISVILQGMKACHIWTWGSLHLRCDLSPAICRGATLEDILMGKIE